ncbi:hypothetical protein VNI00_004720 [Paramarasmius palmivorus]|uniref:Uncharacterized protein n=1 Tax=Paramarasmius palmivorus TaxID=297713 RepID=A0AAW0DLI2_9AGAR
MATVEDYLSNTVDHEALRARVQPGGVLSNLPQNIDSLGDDWAGNASVEDLTTIDQPNTYMKNYVNVNAAGEEKILLYLGEILGFAQGTALAPFGNFNIPEKGNPKAMDDDSVVKQIIVIGKPSFGDPYINGCFTNQVVALHEAISAEGDAEKAINQASSNLSSRRNLTLIQSFASVRPPYKHIAASASDPPDALIFHTERLYELPPAARAAAARAAAAGIRVVATPKYEKVALKRPMVAPGEPASAPAQAEAPKTDAAPEVQKKLAVGDYIEPACLPGYGGPLCNLSQSKVPVPDFRKADGSLANPSEHFKVIAPGTLAWVSAVLKAWIYFDKEKKLKRKFYHLCITSIDVLDPTPFTVKIPEVRLSIRPIANIPSPRKLGAGNSAARNLLRPAKSDNDAPTSTASSSTSSPASSSSTVSSSGDVEMDDNEASPKRARKANNRR